MVVTLRLRMSATSELTPRQPETRRQPNKPRSLRAGLIAAVALLAAVVPGQATSMATGDRIPTARTFDGVPQVGAVFLAGTAAPHICTGSVIRSDERDIVLTAAHCLSGDGRGVQFVPGYHAGAAPYGVWDVSAVYADPRWVSGQDPQHDFAFLVLAPQHHAGRTVRLRDTVTGYRLGTAPEAGRRVTVVAYTVGLNDDPITCTAPTYRFDGFPAFDCHGYDTGVSGAPFLVRGDGHAMVVRGVIGGLHHGGCVEFTSYSPRFDQDVLTTYRRARSGSAPDILPEPGSDGC